MDINLVTKIIDAFGYVVYSSLGVLAVWGSYNVILLYRVLAKKAIRPADADQLLAQVRERIAATGQVQAGIDVCQTPPYWHTALAQLTAVALKARDKGLAKVKQALPIEFHSEIASKIERRLSSISTIAKMGPLIGLLGTVLAMIEAFGRMGEGEKSNPTELAGAISLGLWATAGGLLIATILMILGNDIHNRLRGLRDQTERHVQEIIDLVESLSTSGPASLAQASPRPPAATVSATARWSPR
jgi:biopolymer transport protein ExbB